MLFRSKIDKPDAKPERVRAELLQYEVQVESMGGEVLEIEVSALKRMNLDKLLEAIALQAELLDLRANPERAAEGTVIEARLDRGRGPVATVLVQRGTMKMGDIIVAGSQWGRVRALLDDQGKNVREAGPSFPVEVLGFNGAPEAGDRVAVVENEARAREISEYRERQKRDKLAAQLTWLANRHILNLPEDRRHGRIVPRNPGAQVILPNGTIVRVRMIDISLSGAGISATIRPEIGSPITLGKIPGRVVRHLEDGFAIEFTRLQHPDSLEENASAQ